MAYLSDADVGLMSDDEVGVGGGQNLSDADVGLLSDDQVGIGSDRPAPEGPFMSGLREAAHAAIPTIAGSIAAGVGAFAGAPAGPVGSLAGGAAGFIGGSMAGDYLQEKALHAAGINDDIQRSVNEEANPKSSFVGGLAPALATMSPVAGAKVAQRLTGAAIMGGFEAGGEYLHDGHVDIPKAGIAAIAGAAFPAANRVGEKLMGLGERGAQRGAQMLPGRPNRAPAPDAAQAHADVGQPSPADPNAEADIADTPLGEGATTARTGETTGNPQSAPTRSERVYSKDTQVAPDQDPLTQGDMDPATASALEHANPSPEPSSAPLGEPHHQDTTPQGDTSDYAIRDANGNVVGGGSPGMYPPPPKVNAGFPKEGEPVAVGANEATPLPVRDVALDKLRDGAADEGEKTVREATGTPKIKKMPELKGETPINDSITPAQKVAGNYPKAWVQDFGKPVKIETHEGDIRRSHPDAAEPWEVKSPYDYGYFGKTKGPDGDPIDVARPRAGSPEEGTKHFIIDQKDATTGKYDEPKVFTYFKDKDAAVDAYHRGFSDGKGPDRLHDITEVDRSELVKYLAKHSNRPPKGPYGEPMPKTKPLAERAVVQDAVAKLRAKGDDAGADALLNAPPEKLAAAIEGKRVRKYGTATGASAGYPVKGVLTEDGKPVTANTKAKAEARSAMHQKIADWFEESKPPSQMDPSKETAGELLTRIKNHPYPAEKGAWIPAFRPREWMLAREAKNLLAKPTPANVEKFRAAERDLRGSEQDVYNYRHGNRTDADIAMNRKGGDEAIAKAEAKLARPHDAEDAMIEAIDRKRAGAKFDVPHEEAESMVEPRPIKTKADLKETPHKTVDVADTALAIDTKAISKDAMTAAARRKAEAKALSGKIAEKEAAPTGKAKKPSIDISDPAQMKRLIELSNKTVKRGRLSDEELNKLDLAKEPEKGSFRAEFNKVWDAAREFKDNESGSLNIQKIKDDIRQEMKLTPPKSSIARTPKASEVNADYTRSVSDDFHRLSQEHKVHRVEIQQDADKLMKALGKKIWGPKELLKHLQGGKSQRAIDKLYKDHIDEALKDMYRAREADSAHVDLPGKLTGKTNVESLSPKLKEIYDEYLDPVFQENDQLFKELQRLHPDKMGPGVENHIARLTKGDTSEYNLLKDRDDPTGPQYNGLSVDATMAHERPFVAFERVSDGKRFVVQNRDNGFTLHDRYKSSFIKDPDYKFEANTPYQIKSKKGSPVDVIMREATAKEIADNALGKDGKGKPMRYYENAALSAYMTNAQLGAMARNEAYLHNLMNTPKWHDLTSTNPETKRTKGYIETTFPNLKNVYMDPQLAYVLDDYAKPGVFMNDTVRALSQNITKLMFWMPTAHMANVGVHWFIGRGWSNFNVARLYRTGSVAIRSVVTQDPLQRDLAKSGASLIYPGVQTRDFIHRTGQRLGEEMERDPGRWGPIADKIGVPLGDLSRWIYGNSSSVMWAANDMFLTQHILELEERGFSRAQAIAKAEQDIPPYRVPTTINGDGKYARAFSQVMQDPTIMSFGRYHYGMFNSYANIIKEALGKDSTAGDRVEAAGKLLMMGVMGYIVYPVLDKVYQKLTGNKDASANRRGPMSVIHHLNAAYEGKEDVMSAARASLTVPPIASTALETLSNKDFRGKNIVEPGTSKKAAHLSPTNAGRAGVEFGEHLARGLVSPYGTFANAYTKNKEPGVKGTLKAVGTAVRDQALDIKNPSAAAGKWNAQSDIRNFRDERVRARKGGYGPIESLYNKVFGNQ